MPYGYAMHRFVLDKSGHPCDYIFIEVSSLFETYSGLKANDIIGKRVTEVLPSIKEDTFDWIGVYSKVAYQNETVEFEQYSEALQKWFSVKAYSPHKGFFVTFIRTFQRKKRWQKRLQPLKKPSNANRS